MDRFGDKVCCNPNVKLKKQESYPVIDIDKITPGYKAVRSVASIEYTGQGGAKFQDHDVLFARITPCLENGKMAIADTEGQNGIGSTELFVFRGIDGVSDTDYVYYLLCMKHIRQLAANSMTGASGRQRADLDFIKRIQWDFPDIEMQKKIASVLSAYDNLIEVNNKRIDFLEQIAENLYKEWFVRFRFPGHETAEFENGIPEGWAYRRADEVIDFNPTLKNRESNGVYDHPHGSAQHELHGIRFRLLCAAGFHFRSALTKRRHSAGQNYALPGKRENRVCYGHAGKRGARRFDRVCRYAV